MQKFEVAMNYQEKGLEIKIKLIKGNDPSLASSYFRMGEIYSELGNETKALEYYEMSLEMRKRLFSGDHPDIARSLNNLGLSYSNLGDKKKSSGVCQKRIRNGSKII